MSAKQFNKFHQYIKDHCILVRTYLDEGYGTVTFRIKLSQRTDSLIIIKQHILGQLIKLTVPGGLDYLETIQLGKIITELKKCYPKG